LILSVLPDRPSQIRSCREDEIRECIGCNMCTSGDYLAYPMRCPQNPTMGEEWRRDWHPVRIDKAGSTDTVLIVGGGPTGLEAALALSDRGYEVILSEANKTPGGRVLAETAMRSLSDWRRVADHRTYMLSQRANVQMTYWKPTPLMLPLLPDHTGKLTLPVCIITSRCQYLRMQL